MVGEGMTRWQCWRACRQIAGVCEGGSGMEGSSHCCYQVTTVEVPSFILCSLAHTLAAKQQPAIDVPVVVAVPHAHNTAATAQQ